MRALLKLLLLTSAVAVTAEADPRAFAGRPVADVIDEYRAGGEPFAYSTNLVSDDLVVTAEPDPGPAIDVVRQILGPHGLSVAERSGVYLVVRIDTERLQAGTILLVITTGDAERPLREATVSFSPALSARNRIKPGIYEYSGVSPGRYRLDIEAPGFATVRRVVDVWPGETKIVTVDMNPAKPGIETIAVHASRYEILREIAASRFILDQRTIQTMPDVGEDPMRVTQRLPGAAAGGVSAKTHFRGGDDREVGIMLNGQWLFDPYHIRDYQSIFSAIDSRAIEGVEVYTGGFPVRFGNRMSGLVLMESLEPVRPRRTEIGLSVFNTSFLTAGSEAERRWLLSARRGNLDLVIDREFGRPSYYDLFAEFAYDFSSDTAVSLNALYANDSVEVILESDPEELERVVSRTHNAQLWIQVDNRWSPWLSSQTVLSATAFDNRRVGSLADEEKVVGSVLDDREVTSFGLRQDFTLRVSDRHLVQWGLHASYAAADYIYRNGAQYFGLPAMFRNQPASASLDLAASPEGGSYSLYFSNRWKISEKSVLEWGLRRDEQTYTGLPSDTQLSPRLSFLHALGADTELRLSWGRYHQPQRIHELQIEDGVTRFWPAQRADHFIAGIRHRMGDSYSLRVELFHKDMQRIQPRFENLYDPLALIPEIMPDRVRLAPTSAKAVGLEISLDRSNGPLTWWASYVLSEAVDRIDGRDELRSWDQRHALQGGISWSNEKWAIALATSVHTGWPLTELSLVGNGVGPDGDPVFRAVPGARNAGRHPTFASLDFRLSRSWKLRRGSFMAFLEISNLTNRDNQCCLDWDLEEDERTGEDVLERGADFWLPLLPALGVLWAF